MKKCSTCGGTEFVKRIKTGGVHYGALYCRGCGRWQAWIPKPGGERTRRPGPHRNLVRKYSRGFCELCLRPGAELPGGQTLEAHHVREFQDGGPAGRQNVWILCTSCAKLIHWMRAWMVGKRKVVDSG